jgi:hypothetical protein
VATPAKFDDHITLLLRSFVDPSSKDPMAVSCWALPLAIAGLAGVIASETRAGGGTVTVIVPDTPSKAAVIVAVPTPTAVTVPDESTTATVESLDVHAAVALMLTVPPSP